MFTRWGFPNLAGWRLRLLFSYQDSGLIEEAMPLLQALQERAAAQTDTQLRDLHQITSLRQSKALKLVRALEGAGLVEVGTTTLDRLGSSVSLTSQAEKILQRKQAA